MENQKKSEKLNVPVEADLFARLDKTAGELTRTRAQVVRIILRQYYDLVDQGKVDPIK